MRRILLLSLLLAGCSQSAPTPETAGSRQNLQGLELAGIRSEPARSAPLQSALELTGQVGATEQGMANVTSPLNGVVLSPMVKTGERVSKGQPLATINSVYGQTALQLMQKLEQDQTTLVTAQSSLAQARSNLSQAQTSLAQSRSAESAAVDNVTQSEAEFLNASKDVQRRKFLEKTGVFSVSDVDDARERYVKAVAADKDARYALRVARQGIKLAQSNVSLVGSNVPLLTQTIGLAQANLERDKAVFKQSHLSGANLPQNLTPVGLGSGVSSAAAAEATSFYIRSPIAGVVTNVTMTAGLSVAPGTALAIVVDTASVYVDANAFPTDLAAIHVGDRLEVSTEAAPQKKLKGRVVSVGKQVDPTTRTIPVRSLIENRSGLLRPSMYVTVRLLSSHRAATLVVPENAVLIHGANRYLFVEKGPGKFEKRAVQVGLISGGQAEIVSGLKPGERVVTNGNLILEGQ